MPREIADSDDELDLAPPRKLTRMNIIEHVAATDDTWNQDQLDPVLGTDFDQFLSPTQRLSSYDGNHESSNDISTSKFLDSSTNRFLDAVAPSSGSPSQNIDCAAADSQSADSDMSGKRAKEKVPTKSQDDKKRSRALMEDGDNVTQEKVATKKKAKATYGSASTSSMKSKDASEFETMIHDSRHVMSDGPHGSNSNDASAHLPGMVSVDARTDYTSPLDLSLHLSPTNGMPVVGDGNSTTRDTTPASVYAPHQPYQSRDNYYGSNLRGVTTSNSSMGNYQSFSINPEKLGMDFDKINPFGSLSQVSLPGDLDSEETRGIADIFRNSASYSTRGSSTRDSERSRNMLPDVEHDMQTSPIKGENEFNLRSRDPHSEQDEAQCSPPFSQITNTDEQNTEQSAGKSRRRLEREIAATVDDPLTKPAPKKRGRKAKNVKKIDTSKVDQNDVDELQADEQLLDRSKRAGTIDSVSNMSEISQTTNSSQRGKKRKVRKSDMAPPEVQSKKLPSSDLGLDNKAIIGLSPERYVPRPSRRRGQVEPEVLEPSENEGDLADEQADVVDEVPTKPSPAKGKKGKKGKKKGGKAASSAVAKKSEEFIAHDSDIEDAVPDDEPSTNATSEAVLGGERKQISRDEIAEGEEDEEKDEDIIRGGQRRTKISVDIPVLAKPNEIEDLPLPVAEPKKRGRKRKKMIEEAAVVEPDDIETTRTPLSEKHVNEQIKKSKTEEFSEDEPIDQENQDTKPSKQDEENELKEEAIITQTKPTNTTPLKSTTIISTTSAKSLASTPLFNARARIGLSKRHSIPSLLRKVDRNKEAPKNIEKKEKVTKRVLEEREQERIAREEAEAEGREYKPLDQLRDKDGRLVEWDF